MAEKKQITPKTTGKAANNNSAKKTAVKKKVVKRPAAQKANPATKTTAKKSSVKKAVTKKAVKKTTTKKAPAKKTARKTAKKAAPKVTIAKKPAAQARPATTMSSTIFNFQPPILEIAKMTKAPFQFDQLAQEAADAGRENFEAFVKSGTIFAKGFEDFIKTASNLSQGAAEKQAEYAKQLMASKTLNEFAETQNKIAQANFDQFMAGATKLSEISVKLLSDGAEPINSQLNKTIQKANKAMAA